MHNVYAVCNVSCVMCTILYCNVYNITIRICIMCTEIDVYRYVEKAV